jgi:hypothetical protein
MDIWKKNDRNGLLFRLGGSNQWVEGPSYLFDTITKFPESGFEELHIIMEVFLSQRTPAVCTNIERAHCTLKGGRCDPGLK